MENRLQLHYRDRIYDLELDQGQLTAGPDSASGTGRWHVTVAGTALTSFAARADDDEAAVRERLRRWIDDHPQMETRDEIHLGGG
jgi:hypothetical protein